MTPRTRTKPANTPLQRDAKNNGRQVLQSHIVVMQHPAHRRTIESLRLSTERAPSYSR